MFGEVYLVGEKDVRNVKLKEDWFCWRNSLLLFVKFIPIYLSNLLEKFSAYFVINFSLHKTTKRIRVGFFFIRKKEKEKKIMPIPLP